MANRGFALSLSLAVLFGLSCGCREHDPPAEPPASQPESKALAKLEAPAPVTVKIGDEKDLAELVRQNRGKVVLVDFWATWCIGCLQLFPHTVELHRTLADKGLAVISVSMDHPAHEKHVLTFLSSHRATFDNLLSRYSPGNEAAEAFDIPAGLPHYKLFDRMGKLRHELSIEPDDPLQPRIDAAVKRLLAEN